MMRRISTLAIGLLALACADEGDRLGPPDPVPDAGMSADDAGSDPDAGTAADSGVVVTGNEDVEMIDLGTVMTGTAGEAEVTFELPDGVVSFMVLIAGEPNVFYIVETLDGPSGNLVSDDDSGLTQIERFLLGPFAAQFKGPNRVVQDTGLAAALFPNNPNVIVLGGAYRMTIAGLELAGQNGTPYVGPLDVTIYYRTIVPTRGRLDVSLYLSGAGDITADTAPADPMIQGALAELGNIYAQASITLGVVSYYDVDQRFRSIPISLDGSGGLLEEMFTESGGRGPGLHFFLVDRFEGGIPGAMVAGIAGGLPGPPLSVGTGNSGVAVAISTANGDPKILAHVMAHEGGHWLGLFHTSEFTGTEDQLPDTPAGQAGDVYLMYPAVGGGTMISPAQTNVLLNHIETVRH